MVAYMYVMYTMDSSVLLNSGLLRPARCIIPEGSLVNPKYPAAVGMRSLGAMRLQSCVFGAFAQALPHVMPAACGDGGPLINVRTTDPRTSRLLMANLDPITGGAGGVAFRDGTEGSGANFAFLKNTPVEINEAEVPVKILRYGLATDSGGAGRWRGGTGTTLEFQVFSPHTMVTARNRDRSRFTPWGMEGGHAGKPSSFFLNPGSNREVNLGNTDFVTMDPGDVLRITSAGAGGYGSPLEREPERVLTDVRRGFVTRGSGARGVRCGDRGRCGGRDGDRRAARTHGRRRRPPGIRIQRGPDCVRADVDAGELRRPDGDPRAVAGRLALLRQAPASSKPSSG